MRERVSYNYDALKSYIARGRSKHDRPLDKVSLRAHLYGDDVVVRMYRTDLARFKPDGTIVLNMGGWEASITTRANVGEITGVRVYTIAQHKKRRVIQSTRIYAGHQFPYGLPYTNGCIIKHGTCIWHPWMKEQGIDDIAQLTEKIKVVNMEKAKPYYFARRALVNSFRHMYGFVDAKVVAEVNAPRNATWWFEDILTDLPAEEDTLATLLQLVRIGCPSLHETWKKAPEFGIGDVAGYVQKGMAKCAGAGSWRILDAMGAIDTISVPCKEV